MSSTDAIKDFFDRLAPAWEEDIELAPIREEITKRASFPENCRIADIGCGTGIMVPHLMGSRPKQIIELDLSEEMMRLNRERWGTEPGITFICSDVVTAALPILDATVIFNAYPHFLDKEALAGKLSSTLRTKGTLIIAHSRGRASINGIHRDNGPCERISIPLKTPPEEYESFRRYFSLEDWEDSSRLYFMKLKKK